MPANTTTGRNHRFKDLTNQPFGRWTVLELVKTGKGGTFWRCQCQCGTVRDIDGHNLRRGLTESCGCLKVENFARRVTTHHRCRTSEYTSWYAMKQRCYNPKNKSFHNYGGRGITVCEQWRQSFEQFLTDMGEKPDGSYTIDRIDVNGCYEPTNCRWATKKEQRSNQRRQ